MRLPKALTAIVVLSLAPACGSADDAKIVSKKPSADPMGKVPDDSVSQAGAFTPPPVAEGYTRLAGQTIHDIEPAGDVTYCQYVMLPLDHDVDVLDLTGAQSQFGHHAAVFSYTDDGSLELGANLPCMGTEYSAGTGDPSMSASAALNMGTFLGGVGGPHTSRSLTLPDGVGFRLKKGDGVMLNVHYLNTSDKVVDGDAVVDLKFAEPDPNRTIASLFLNLNLDFKLPPNAPTSSTVNCVAQSDVQILMMSNHMHEFGTSATTEVIRADGKEAMLRDDTSWTYEMQFNPVFSQWTIADPFVLKAGDTLRTTCRWENSQATELEFPREMCVGVGFALTTGDNPHAPACANGAWLDHLL